MNTGSKTNQPVPLDEATKIWTALVKSKTAKGYKPVEGSDPDAGSVTKGIGSSVTDREQRDTGLRPQLLNPISEEEAEKYLTDDRWAAQKKFDGKRMMLSKKENVTAANRKGLSIGFPDVMASQLILVDSEWVIDGEAVGEKLYLFDLLESSGVDAREEPYSTRYEILSNLFTLVGKNIIVAPIAVGTEAKRKLMADLKAEGAEGIVFKDMRATWYAGRPASGGSAIKMKFWASCSCVVKKINAKHSVELVLGGESVGNVTIAPSTELPEPGQVVEIRYLYAYEGGSLYQPRYLGVRDDIDSDECTIEKQHLKYKAEED